MCTENISDRLFSWKIFYGNNIFSCSDWIKNITKTDPKIQSNWDLSW